MIVAEGLENETSKSLQWLLNPIYCLYPTFSITSSCLSLSYGRFHIFFLDLSVLLEFRRKGGASQFCILTRVEEFGSEVSREVTRTRFLLFLCFQPLALLWHISFLIFLL